MADLEPAVLATLLGVFATLVLGIVGYLRGARSDANVETHRMIEMYQEDNRLLRDELARQAAERKTDRHEDMVRQDEVAARLTRVNALVHEREKRHGNKLDEIHVLVNSNLTAALAAQLEATKAQVVLMEDAPNTDPAKLELVRAKVVQLEETLRERLEAEALAGGE